EIETGAAILPDVEIVAFLADARAQIITSRSGRLDPGGRAVALLAGCKRHVHGEAGYLLGDGPPLHLIGIENPRWVPAGQWRGDRPGQVGRVGNPGVHAVTGGRYPQMRGVTADEHAPVAKTVGDEAAADPVFARDHLVTELRTDAEDRADRPVTVDGI